MAKRVRKSDTYINKMSIEGFKGFYKKAEFPLRPLTILMGGNNSGKSAIIKSIASFCQTKIAKAATGSTEDWLASGPWFDLGAKSNFLNSKSKMNAFTIGFGTNNGMIEYYLSPNDKDLYSCKIDAFGIFPNDSPSFGGIKLLTILEGLQKKYPSVKSFLQDKDAIMRHLNQYVVVPVNSNTEDIVKVIEGYLNCGKAMQKATKIEDSEEKLQRFYELFSRLGYDKKFVNKQLDTLNESVKRNEQMKQFVIKKMNEKIDNVLDIRNLEVGLTENLDSINIGGSLQTDATPSIPVIRLNLTGDSIGGTFVRSLEAELRFIFRKARSKVKFPSTAFLLSLHENLNSESSINKFSHQMLIKENYRSMDRHLLNTIDPQFFRATDQLFDSEFLGAFRLKPERVYNIRNESQPYHKTMNSICKANKRELEAINSNLQELVNTKIFPTPLQVKNLENQQYYEICVGENKDSAYLHLPDVGYGISQLLPVLAQLNSKNTLLIEEAESNLHPKAQAKLMDIIAENIDKKTKQPQIIMESHSEHFLMRIKQLISEGKLDDEDVALIFLSRNEEMGTLVHHAETVNGEFIEPIPSSFDFYEGYNPTGSIIG